MIKCFYITIPRVICVILQLASLTYLATYVPNVDILSGVLFIASLIFLTVILANFTVDLFFTAPDNVDVPDIEYDGQVVKLNDKIGEITYNDKGEELGICKGIYFTKEYSSIMIKGIKGKNDLKLYDAKDIYFKEEDE